MSLRNFLLQESTDLPKMSEIMAASSSKVDHKYERLCEPFIDGFSLSYKKVKRATMTQI